MNAMDFDDLLVRSVNLLELFQEVRDRYATAFRWILVDEYQDTNHAQYRWLQLLASEHRNLAVVGDDAQIDLRLQRSGHQEHPEFRGRLRRRPRRQARAELPLDADDPVRRQRGVANNRGQMDEGAVDRDRRGRPDQGPGAGRRARRGALRRGRDRADGRRGRQPRGDRRLLPDQRAVAGARGHARAGADRLPGHRRHEVLRARGDPGRGGVPDVPRQPAGRAVVHARRQLAQARARADVALPRALARGHDGHHRLGGGGAAGDRARASAPRRRRRSGASCRRWCACASGWRARPVGDLLDELLRETGYYDALEAERTIEAQGRLENLQELVRVGARVRRAAPSRAASASSCSRSR